MSPAVLRRASGALFVEPGHAGAQRLADFLDLMVDVVLQELLIALAAGGVLLDPLARELARLHFLQHLAHLALHPVVDDARATGEVTVLRSLADELVHLAQAALVQQVDDELQLVQALVVGDFRLITGLDQGLEAFDDELGRSAAEHCLLSEQVGLGLLGEGGLEYAATRAADAVRIGQGLGVRLAGRILGDGNETRYTASLLILPAHQVAGPLGCDQHYIQILTRLDLLEMNVESMSEEQRRAGPQLGLYAV